MNPEEILEELKPKRDPLSWLIVPMLFAIVGILITILAFIHPFSAVVAAVTLAVSGMVLGMWKTESLEKESDK